MAILGAVLIIGGGAGFVYFDPLDMDLLGLNPPVVQPVPKVQPRPAKSGVPAPGTPAVGAPSVAPTGAPKSATPTTPQVTAGAPQVVGAPPVTTDHKAAALVVSDPASAHPVAQSPSPAVPAEAAPEINPPLKMSHALKSAASKPAYPPSVDLRHCLDQPTPQDIAKCAGE